VTLGWRLSDSVDDRETSEPPRTQFVKETETFLSVDLLEGMVGGAGVSSQKSKWFLVV
jgi:hypothetical protein